MTPTTPSPTSNAFVYVWRSPWVRTLTFLLFGFLAWKLVGRVSSVIMVFTVAFLIAYIAAPLLNWLERGRVRRGLGVFFVLLIFAGIFSLAGVLLVTVSTQFIQLFQKLPDLVGNLGELLDRLSGWMSQRGVHGMENIREKVITSAQDWVQNLGDNVVPILQNALSGTGTLVSGLLSIGGIVGQVLLILLLSVYLMLDYSRVNTSLLQAFPRPWQPRVLELSDLTGKAVGGYVRGQLLIATFIGLFVWVGLTIVGIPSAAAIGFLAGAFNIVPYLGPVIGATPAMLLALTMPDPALKVALVVLVFILANQIESNFLSPYILSKTTDLHPVTVLLAILVGVALLGFLGALLAVPAVALGKLLLQKYYYPSRVYTEGPSGGGGLAVPAPVAVGTGGALEPATGVESSVTPLAEPIREAGNAVAGATLAGVDSATAVAPVLPSTPVGPAPGDGAGVRQPAAEAALAEAGSESSSST